MQSPDFRCTSFDVVMKMAQLSFKMIPCSALMVDESQDLTECQISFICNQSAIYYTPVYIVGDAVQSIYGFRGAKSKYLQEIDSIFKGQIIIRDFKLDKSFRFDDNIGAIANILLACKEFSPQTFSDKQTRLLLWQPYRITGGSEHLGHVEYTSDISTFSNGFSHPITVIAATNVALFVCALNLLALGVDSSSSSSSSSSMSMSGRCAKLDIKIALNGTGASSGASRWKGIESKLREFTDIFIGAKQTLSCYPWNGADNITWEKLVKDIEEFELEDLIIIIKLVETYGDQTMVKYQFFKEKVLNRSISLDEADVILSTVHAAKGMEWDRVMVLGIAFFSLHKSFKIKAYFLKAYHYY